MQLNQPLEVNDFCHRSRSPHVRRQLAHGETKEKSKDNAVCGSVTGILQKGASRNFGSVIDQLINLLNLVSRPYVGALWSRANRKNRHQQENKSTGGRVLVM